MGDFIKGADISTLDELEKLGARYFDKGRERPLPEILFDYGFNWIRLKLWNDPFSPTGEPFGAGTNDLATTIALGKRCVQHGFKLLLNFHYSDFWADPGKQFVPRAWNNYSDSALEDALYGFTESTLRALVDQGVRPAMVQIGNEISNGLLWPRAKRPNYDAIARFVKAGIRALRSVLPECQVMIHLDQGGNNELYREWFDNFMQRGGDFDVMGLSYYPFWHGTLEGLEHNMNDMALRYEKDIVVVETSMGFTVEDYSSREGLSLHERKGMATKPALVEKVPFPMTKEGQCEFLSALISRIRNVAMRRGRGFFYWEPGWIPVKGSGWANQASLRYIEDPGPGGNEWANQALFNYDGEALPSLECILRS